MAPGFLWGKDVIFGVLADFGVKMVECGWVQMKDDECDGWMWQLLQVIY